MSFEGIILEYRAGVHFSSGALWRAGDALRYTMSASIGKKQGKSVWGQSKAPLCGVAKVCELSTGSAWALEIGGHGRWLAAQTYMV